MEPSEEKMERILSSVETGGLLIGEPSAREYQEAERLGYVVFSGLYHHDDRNLPREPIGITVNITDEGRKKLTEYRESIKR